MFEYSKRTLNEFHQLRDYLTDLGLYIPNIDEPGVIEDFIYTVMKLHYPIEACMYCAWETTPRGCNPCRYCSLTDPRYMFNLNLINKPIKP